MKGRANRIKVIAGAALCGLFLSCPNNHPVSLVFFETMAMNRQTQCTIQSGGGMQYLKAFGVLDLAVTNHYYLFPHIMNNMPSSMALNKSNSETLGVEANYVTIMGGHVVLNIPMDIYKKASSKDKHTLYSAMTDGYFVPASGGIKPDSDAVTELEVIPPRVGRILRDRFKAETAPDSCLAPMAEVYAYVRIEGRTLSGYTLSSNEYMFPIKLCWGCLIRYVTDDPDAEVPKANSAPCMPGQDDALSNVLCTRVSLDTDICYPQNACTKSQ